MINIGIIGMGRMGKMHAPFLNANPDAKIVAFYDPNPEASANASQLLGIAPSQSALDVVNSPSVDAVFITSPTYCHCEALIPAMKTGKPVFCEKPVCRTVDECDELMDLADESKSVVTIGFVRRYHDIQKKFQEIVKSGQLGTIRSAAVDLSLGVYKRMRGDWFADFELSGGVVLDMLAHHLDLLLWGLGDVSSVYARGLLCSKDLPLPVDFCSATVTFACGTICNILANWERVGRSNNYMEFMGDNGSISYTFAKDELTLSLIGQEPQIIKCPKTGDIYQIEDNTWIASILNNTKPVVTLEDGIKAFRFADDILESASSRCEIVY